MCKYITEDVEILSDEENFNKENYLMKKVTEKNKFLFWKSNFKNFF